MFPRLQKEAACLELPFSVPWMHFTEEVTSPGFSSNFVRQISPKSRNQRPKISVIFVS